MAGQRPKTGLDLVEEATYLLRNAPAGALAAYYIGTLPFALAFLFFWADMGRSSTAYEYCAPAALGVAAMFLWMSVWQAIFAQGLRSKLTGTQPAPFRRLALVQATLQPTKLIAVPAAILLTVPLGAVFAFYQNLMAVPYEEAQGIHQPFASARRQAGLWQGQNWAVLGIVSILAIVVFANIGALLLLVPQLLKSFLGIQTALARSEVLALNSTFLAITAALTYAIVDPLVKAVYVLRCFYGESLATGEDLKAQLKAIAARVAIIMTLIAGAAVHAQPPAPAAPSGPAVQDINRSIDSVLNRPQFSWRFPHRQQPGTDKNWFARALDEFLTKLDQWSDQFVRWLHEHFRSNQSAEPRKGLPSLQTWFYVLLSITILIFLVLFFRAFQKRSRVTVAAEAITAAAPDLESEHTRADLLPADEWLRTARDCIARNELRLAVRALYLANLAYLGGRSLLAIERGKSNNDYVRELRRRARSKPEILPFFNDTIGVFERSWYGMYDVSSELVSRIEENLARTRAYVEG